MAPLRRLNVDRIEFVCLKALLLLQSDLNGLSMSARESLCEARESVQRALFTNILQYTPNPVDAAVRLSSLLGVLPSLGFIAQTITVNATLGPLFGLSESSTPSLQFEEIETQQRNVAPPPPQQQQHFHQTEFGKIEDSNPTSSSSPNSRLQMGMRMTMESGVENPRPSSPLPSKELFLVKLLAIQQQQQQLRNSILTAASVSPPNVNFLPIASHSTPVSSAFLKQHESLLMSALSVADRRISCAQLLNETTPSTPSLNELDQSQVNFIF